MTRQTIAQREKLMRATSLQRHAAVRFDAGVTCWLGAAFATKAAPKPRFRKIDPKKPMTSEAARLLSIGNLLQERA